MRRLPDGGCPHGRGVRSLELSGSRGPARRFSKNFAAAYTLRTQVGYHLTTNSVDLPCVVQRLATYTCGKHANYKYS